MTCSTIKADIQSGMERASKALEVLDECGMTYTRILVVEDAVEIWIEENVRHLLSSTIYRTLPRVNADVLYHVAIIQECEIKWRQVIQK